MSEPSRNYKAFVGIDWADKKHDICLQPAGSTKREFYSIPHDVKKIDEWALGLFERFAGPIAVAVELSRGPIVYALQKYDFLTIFPINPTTLARYRDTFHLSGAKDDPTDAEIAMDLMLRYPEQFKPLNPQSVEMRKLMYLVEQRRKLVEDRRRFANRLINTLKQYYPQPLDWFSHRSSTLFCKLIIRWSSLQKLKRARESTVIDFFRANKATSNKLLNQRLEAIKEGTPLTDDPAVLSAHQLQAVAIAEQMLATIKAIKTFDIEIEKSFWKLPYAKLFDSLPGAGLCLAPRLLVAFGEQRDRFSSAREVQQYAGVAPVTVRSGNKEWIHWRWQCSKFLRQTFVEWAGETIDQSFWAGVYYHQHRAKGKSYQVAVRALAFKWIRILYRCWKTKTPYNEVTYLNSLKRRGSPLVACQGQPPTIPTLITPAVVNRSEDVLKAG